MFKQITKKTGLKAQVGKIRLLLVIITLAIFGIGVYIFITQENKNSNNEVPPQEKITPTVKVVPFSELLGNINLKKTVTIEPALSAPLISRVGGRVTEVKAKLGDNVNAGAVVVAIDSNGEPNLARTQLNSAKQSLSAFNSIYKEAIKSADLAVKTAEISLDALKKGKSLTVAQVNKSKEQADLSVRQAQLALTDAIESENRVDALVRSADIASQAANLAQDQASLASKLVNKNTADAIKQAEQGLQTAIQGKEKLNVDLNSQKIAIEAQMSVANEQLRLAQITTPLAGQVTKLSVSVGDFVQPGQSVGEVIAFAGAKILTDVNTAIRQKLSIGQIVNISSNGQNFTGEIVRLANAPQTDIALWQVDILIAATPEVVHPGDLAVVEFPAGVSAVKGTLIPLDAIVVRQTGIVIMTVDKDNTVVEHIVTPVSYTGDYVEGIVDLPDSAIVIVEGSKTLRDGDQVQVQS